VVYPWYRAAPPEGTTDLSSFPRYLLLANESTAQWHEFGMEWKEHVAFLAPIAATVVAYVVSYYGPLLARKVGERRAVMIFFIVAFIATAVAGMFGAFITKAAAVR
jgi:MFS-type transporter involved in bile tolerance (Atg22 family)